MLQPSLFVSLHENATFNFKRAKKPDYFALLDPGSIKHYNVGFGYYGYKPMQCNIPTIQQCRGNQ